VGRLGGLWGRCWRVWRVVVVWMLVCCFRPSVSWRDGEEKIGGKGWENESGVEGGKGMGNGEEGIGWSCCYIVIVGGSALEEEQNRRQSLGEMHGSGVSSCKLIG